ncbi:hypothetical protein SD70_06120 [Gordoniibacillus kamchatkensis]|uniref:Uncharacterized protein n=1 Tax=Gordoniibacillus kamchatkensis TaxID=1590651 RepID=A0ABR5AMV0_9BACL|nr:hypothetical protein [Paenibacillus sp. VKM B-2647]KIL41682.1 hypothetical protein SD70_06120 [Paenibacillus sp. VKM B-2647]
MPLIVPGGALVALGTAAFAVNLTVTFVHAKQWTPVIVGIFLSLIDLCATVALGMAMGVAEATGSEPHRYDLIFAEHLWIGLGGWLSGLIVACSLKLLPMFYVSKKKATNLNYVIVVLLQAGVWLGAAGEWTGSSVMAGPDVWRSPLLWVCLPGLPAMCGGKVTASSR